ncbi:MAG: amidohydrolase [Rhizobiales bacterium]|nr:M20 family metallopeptidase [Hyphomicrobiales bacterium]NRB15339.1 amidohydrolase [Hyphomicrobiales bacterium]
MMIKQDSALHKEMTGWRQTIHANPETGFEEFATAAFVKAELLKAGVEIVAEQMAVTGIVAVVHGTKGGSNKAIALRADMDALPMQEMTGLDYGSKNDGKMHACGHDGHTTMLLGAAKYLNENNDFAGSVYFIFQPAEEGYGGAKKMIDEGLFDKFSIENVYGMHNWPGMELGTFAVRGGPVMAAADEFYIDIKGRGGHGAMPHSTIDAVTIATQMVVAFQSIVARNVDPMDTAVLSVTQIHSGEAYNVIPELAKISGTVRSFKAEVKQLVKDRMMAIASGICKMHDAELTFEYKDGYPSTSNDFEQAEFCQTVLNDMVGEDNVNPNMNPSMGAEDFSYMLEEKAGAYIMMGNGDSAGLHNPYYNFNDKALPIGASYWVNLVETALNAK